MTSWAGPSLDTYAIARAIKSKGRANSLAPDGLTADAVPFKLPCHGRGGGTTGTQHLVDGVALIDPAIAPETWFLSDARLILTLCFMHSAPQFHLELFRSYGERDSARSAHGEIDQGRTNSDQRDPAKGISESCHVRS